MDVFVVTYTHCVFASIDDAMRAVQILVEQTGGREHMEILQCTVGKLDRGTKVYEHKPPRKRRITEVTPVKPGEDMDN
jgi:hypothetical protein